MLSPEWRAFLLSTSTIEMSFVIRLSSALFVRMSLTMHRTSRASSHSNSGSRMARPPVDDFVILNKQREHAIDRRELRKFVSVLIHEMEIGHLSFAIVF